jgi:nicotinamide phosphoribosyltransferase
MRIRIPLPMRTDSYKVAHWPVYPDDLQYLFSYLESRGGLFQSTVAYGAINYLLDEYLTDPVTMADIDYSEKRFTKHFGDKAVFNRAGWEHIVKDHDGLMPVRIRFVPEGMVVPTHNVLCTIENTCPKCAWTVNYLETIMLKVWYPITVATQSREIKKVIADALEKTGDISLLPFKLHDFGYRGVSSEESAMIGGMAHLVNFMGTDTLIALEGAKEYYGIDMAGYSVPATEHSVMSILGQEGEEAMAERFLDKFGSNPNYPAIACVSDTYDIFHLTKDVWGGTLKNKVENLNNKVLVVRPDSGDPPTIVRQVVEILESKFGATTNDKGYKVLNHVRVIQGDGVNLDSIKRILDALIERNYSADNIAFGMGGALLQQVNRDTQRFAFKASSAVVGGRVRDVQKRPVTDNNKRSKAGRLKLIEVDGVLSTVTANELGHDILQTVYENGKLSLSLATFDQVRERAKLPEKSLSWA